MNNRKKQSVILGSIIVLSVMIGGVSLLTEESQAETNFNPDVEIADARPANGNLTVTVRSNSSTNISGFNLYYNDTGPLNLSNGGILKATKPDGSTYDPATGIANEALTLTLNSSQAPFSYDRRVLNLTVYNHTDFANTDNQNRTMLTMNVASLRTESGAGDQKALGLIFFNGSTATPVHAGASTTAGYWAIHSQGTVDGDKAKAAGGASGSFIISGASPPGGLTIPGQSAEIRAASFSTGNISVQTLDYRANQTVVTDRPGTHVSPRVSIHKNWSKPANITSLKFINHTSGEVVYNSTNALPAIVKTFTPYEIQIGVESGGTDLGTFNYSYVSTSPGFRDYNAQIPDGKEMTKVEGQVVNDSGHPIEDAAVYARTGSSSTGIVAAATNLTDANGDFSMQVPKTDYPNFVFDIVSPATNTSGAPMYYPTTKDNDGNDFQISGEKMLLPQMTIEKGGEVVLTQSQNLSATSFAEINQYTSQQNELRKIRSSSDFAFFDMPFISQTPQKQTMRIPAPVSDQNSNTKFYQLGIYGDSYTGGSPDRVNIGNVSVGQGQQVKKTTSLGKAGYLNLSVIDYQDIITQQNGTQYNFSKRSASWEFWYQSDIVIRNATTGNVAKYLGKEESLHRELLGSLKENTTAGKSLLIPLPEGNYTVDFRPATEWSKYTGVKNSTNVSIQANETVNHTAKRGESFQIDPVSGVYQIKQSSTSTVQFAVLNASGVPLDGTQANVSARYQNLNGSVETDSFELPYNSSTGFFEADVNPSNLNLDGGLYDLRVNASHQKGNSTYYSTATRSTSVIGFHMNLDLGSFSFGPEESVTGKIYAYNLSAETPTPLAINNSNVSIDVYSSTGNHVKTISPDSDITEGDGSVDITMPSKTGHYRLILNGETDNGDQGMAYRWIRVSEVTIDASTGQDRYRKGDEIALTVEATNATSGDPVEGASAVVGPDQNSPLRKTTDSNGEATFVLEPGQFSAGSEWSPGWQWLNIEVTAESSGSVTTIYSGVGFEVQQVRAHISPRRPSFQPNNNVTLDAYMSPNLDVNNVSVVSVDGTPTDVAGENRGPGAWKLNLGTQSAGTHQATVNVNATAGIRNFTTQFEVGKYNIQAQTDRYRYQPEEQINVTGKLTYAINGSAANDTTVVVDLFRSGSPPIRENRTVVSPNSKGEFTIRDPSFNSSRAGPHFLRISANNQRQYLGVSVNALQTKLLNEKDGSRIETIEASPGDTRQVYVNATKAGTAIADGTSVTLSLSAGAKSKQLASNTTTDGGAIVEYTLPSSIQEGWYNLEATVKDDTGAVGEEIATVIVSGGSAVSIETGPDQAQYASGETAKFRAAVKYDNGTALSNENVTFVLGNPATGPEKIGATDTDESGIATLDHTLGENVSSGDYYLKAYLTNSTSISAYDGFTVSPLEVDVSTNESTFNPGDTVQLTIDAINSSDGSSASATEGQLDIYSSLGTLSRSIDTTDTAPYTKNLTLPDNGDIIGSVTFSAEIYKGEAHTTDSSLINVVNATETINISVPDDVSPTETFNVTLNATVDTTATLSIYSPEASETAYQNADISLTANSPNNISLSLNNPGVYAIKADTSSIGSASVIRNLEAENVSIWAGTGLNTNTTQFNTTETVYFKTNTANATATVIGENESFSVDLDQKQGEVRYGTLTTDREADAYLVRLDLPDATDAADTIIEVVG